MTPKPRKPAPPWKRHDLTELQYKFCLAYLANNFNARRAYLSAHPAVTVTTASTEAHRTLSNPKVRAYLNEKIEAAHKPMQVGAEQALARLGAIALFDARDLFDEQGNLMPTVLWPDTVRSMIKGIKPTEHGVAVTLESPAAALRTILEVTGRVRGIGDGMDALADAILADVARRQVKP